MSTATPSRNPHGDARLLRRLIRSTFRILAAVTVALAAGGATGAYLLVRHFARGLPTDLRHLPGYDPARRTVIYARDGQVIGELFLERRDIVPLDAIPRHVRAAFISAEDRNFYKHHGVDPSAILRAVWADLRARTIVQGGSTLTQQLVRNLFLSREVRLDRKIKEAILALRLERQLTKDQILSLYLNHVYLGGGAYGVQAAAQRYFGKDAAHLTVAEAALLAGLPSAPTAYAPTFWFERARARQSYVLGRMVEDGALSPADAARARREPIAVLAGTDLNHVSAPHFVERVRAELTRLVGADSAARGGLRVTTTLDLPMQLAATRAVHDRVAALDREGGWRPPKGSLPAAEAARARAGQAAALAASGRPPIAGERYDAVVASVEGSDVRVAIGPTLYRVVDDDVAWAGGAFRLGQVVPVEIVAAQRPGGSAQERFAPRRAEPDEPPRVPHVALAQTPEAQAALLAVDPSTGAVRALVGGADFLPSAFDRTRQAHRQPGSLFKLFTYAAALEHGWHEVSMIPDAPIQVFSGGRRWSPGNYQDRYLGPVTLRTALAKSLNSVAVRLAMDVGFDEVVTVAHRLGVRSPLAPYLPTVLGGSELTVEEVATAYSAIANLGQPMAPYVIERVTDAAGRALFEAAPRFAGSGLDPAVAYVLGDMLENVVRAGTGRAARALGRPVAGKTGTSNDFRNAWFAGTTPDLTAVAWVGYDDNRPIGRDATGGHVALPMWVDFMKQALGGAPHPVRDFAAPPGVIFQKVAVSRPGQVPELRYLPFLRRFAEKEIEMAAVRTVEQDGEARRDLPDEGRSAPARSPLDGEDGL